MYFYEHDRQSFRIGAGKWREVNPSITQEPRLGTRDPSCPLHVGNVDLRKVLLPAENLLKLVPNVADVSFRLIAPLHVSGATQYPTGRPKE